MKFMDLAFKSLSAFASQNNDLFLAINDLIQKTTDSLMTFGTSIGWLEPAKEETKANTESSLVSLAQGTDDAAKESKSKRLLMAGVNIVTAWISAFEEEPLDFEAAFAAIKLEGR